MPRRKINVPDAAAILGCDPQFLRIALRQGRFSEFGVAVKMKRWAYYICPERLQDYIQGKDVPK